MSDEERVRRLMNRARGQEEAHAADWNDFVHRAHRRLFMSRAAAAGMALVLVAGGVAAGAFLLRDNPVLPAPIPPAASESAQPTPLPSGCVEADDHIECEVEAQRVERVEIWYTDNEALARTVQTIGIANDYPDNAPTAAIKALLDPSIPEGLGSAVPPDPDSYCCVAGLNVVRADDGNVTVDLPASFESGGGSLSMQLRVAQVVFTLTQFPDIKGVIFQIEGRPRDFIGGEGVDVSEPQTRRHFDDLAPTIVVDSPEIGQEFSSGDLVVGTANVFEANVNIRILDENGDEIAATFVTATCGTGCRGDYEKAMKFTIDKEQRGIVQVLTYSAEDGSPQYAVDVPVILTP